MTKRISTKATLVSHLILISTCWGNVARADEPTPLLTIPLPLRVPGPPADAKPGIDEPWTFRAFATYAQGQTLTSPISGYVVRGRTAGSLVYQGVDDDRFNPRSTKFDPVVMIQSPAIESQLLEHRQRMIEAKNAAAKLPDDLKYQEQLFELESRILSQRLSNHVAREEHGDEYVVSKEIDLLEARRFRFVTEDYFAARRAVEQRITETERSYKDVENGRNSGFVRAPYFLEVTNVHVAEGQWVNAGEPLVDVVPATKRWLWLNIPSNEALLSMLHRGNAVMVTLHGDQIPLSLDEIATWKSRAFWSMDDRRWLRSMSWAVLRFRGEVVYRAAQSNDGMVRVVVEINLERTKGDRWSLPISQEFARKLYDNGIHTSPVEKALSVASAPVPAETEWRVTISLGTSSSDIVIPGLKTDEERTLDWWLGR